MGLTRFCLIDEITNTVINIIESDLELKDLVLLYNNVYIICSNTAKIGDEYIIEDHRFLLKYKNI